MLTPQEIINMKKEYFFPNSMHFYNHPPHIVRGLGKYLYDDQGKRYLDFFAGVSVMNCGHSNEFILSRIKWQLDQLQHTSVIYLTQPAVELAQRLAEILPGDMCQTFFCCSGTEANEGALLLSRLYTGKRGFLAFEGGLHGRSSLTMSVTGIPMWRIDPFPDPCVYFAKGFSASQDALSETCGESLRSVGKILEAHGHEIAACIVEPVQGNGGINIPDGDYFRKLKSLLDTHNVLLIADEVQTGFGRTGRYFAIEHSCVVPDILTMAKALGNGTPIGAFSARPHIAQAMNKPSASTLGGNPVSATAGIAVLDYIHEQNLCARSEALGVYFLAKLRELKACYPMILDVRGLGLMLGMTLENAAITDEVLEQMKDRGFLLGKNGMNRNVLAFQPPLIIDETDIDAMCTALGDVLSNLGDIKFTDK